jgi:hypothetical protein
VPAAALRRQLAHSPTVTVDTSAFRPGEITVRMDCTTNLAGLGVAGVPAAMRLHAMERAPLETYRDVGRGG